MFVLFLSWSSPRGSNVEGLGKQNSLFHLELDDKSPTKKNRLYLVSRSDWAKTGRNSSDNCQPLRIT